MGLFGWNLLLTALGAMSALAQFSAPIGGSVYLFGNSQVTPEHSIEWNLDTTGAVIARRISGQNSTYYGRCIEKCELFPNGTLRMDQLISSDNRSYTVTLQLGSVIIKEQIQLNVYNLLTAPSLTPSSLIRPVNGTNLNLRCNAGSQTVHSIYFYRNEQIVSCSLPHLSCNQSSPFLYFTPIMDSDSGNYSCGIQNPVSRNSSAPLTLNVAVRVSGVTLRNNATSPVTAEKDSVSLTCSSYGTDVSYNWTLMGSPLPQNPRYRLTNNNASLVISPVSRSDQGSFMCTVSNYLDCEISNPLNLTWSPDGQIECGAERLDQGVQLYCSWPGGYPPAVVHMMYQDLNLMGFDGIMTEVPAYRFSLGTQLSCNGTHGGASEICSLVIDTPQSAGFINDSLKTGMVGSSVFLSVTLSSSKAGQRLQPRVAQIFPAKFSWFRHDPNPSEMLPEGNVSIISNDYSSFLIVSHMTEELIGHYRCKAENAMGSNSFTFILNVTAEKASTDNSLSAGAIAGIAIGSIGVVALISLTIVLFHTRDRRHQPKSINEGNDGAFKNTYSNVHGIPKITSTSPSNQMSTDNEPIEELYEVPDDQSDHTYGNPLNINAN